MLFTSGRLCTRLCAGNLWLPTPPSCTCTSYRSNRFVWRCMASCVGRTCAEWLALDDCTIVLACSFCVTAPLHEYWATKSPQRKSSSNFNPSLRNLKLARHGVAERVAGTTADLYTARAGRGLFQSLSVDNELLRGSFYYCTSDIYTFRDKPLT